MHPSYKNEDYQWRKQFHLLNYEASKELGSDHKRRQVYDQGNGGKLAWLDIYLPERVSELFLVDEKGLVASRSKELQIF